MRAKKVFYVIAYDIVDDKRRNLVSKVLEKYGTRVNFSVFECMFTDSQLLLVQKKILNLIDSSEDTVIYYPCCINCYTKIVYQPCRRTDANVVLIK